MISRGCPHCWAAPRGRSGPILVPRARAFALKTLSGCAVNGNDLPRITRKVPMTAHSSARRSATFARESEAKAFARDPEIESEMGTLFES